MAWYEALTDGREWNQALDAPRFRRGFVVLARTRAHWPAPLHFVEALPPREQLALTKQPIPADPERALQAIAEAQSMLRSDRPEPEPVEPEPERDLKAGAMSATEAYLQAHYDRKRAAAGDEA